MKSTVLAICAAIAVAISTALCLGGAVSEVVFALLGSAFPVVLMAIGAIRHGTLSRTLTVVFALLGLQLVGSVAWLLHLRGSVGAALASPGGSEGWPLAGTVLLVGLWLSPLLVVGFGYAWTFDRTTLREEDLAELRRIAEGGAPPSDGGAH